MCPAVRSRPKRPTIPRCRMTRPRTRASSGSSTMGRANCMSPDSVGRREENRRSMRYIGDEAPAPRRHDVRLESTESFLRTVLAGVDALAHAGIVHGDLSAFNILVDGERPWFIDFSEAVRVDRLGGSPWVRLTEASKLLTRGLQALQLYFRKYDLTIETEALVEQIV